ncbi:TetR family transcriptional regulator [Actinokineospora soli]
MASNRERALKAAVELLGTGGLRALTHARVDDRAGLPKGSTSNHFRTRAALLDGAVAWMLEQERPEVGRTLDPATPEELLDDLCGLFAFMTGPNRVVTTARMVLWLEAGHNLSLRRALMSGRAVMEELVVPVLARLGACDPVAACEAFSACFQGLFVQWIARGEQLDPRPAFEVVLRGALS